MIVPLLLLFPQTMLQAPFAGENRWLLILSSDVLSPGLLATAASIVSTLGAKSAKAAMLAAAAPVPAIDAAQPASVAAFAAAAAPQEKGEVVPHEAEPETPAKPPSALPKAGGPLRPLVFGLFDDFPNPFVLPVDLPKVVERLLQKAAAAAEQAGQEFDPDGKRMLSGKELEPTVLPGLIMNSVGRQAKLTRREEATNAVVAEVFTRLAGNMVPAPVCAEIFGKDAAADIEPFSVLLAEGAKVAHTTAGSLIQALAAAGHTVQGSVQARLTSFGAGACFTDADGSGVVHIPIAFPFKTGIMRVGQGQNMDPNDQIVSFLPHCSVQVIMTGPLLKKIKLQSYQGIEGYYGWFAVNEVLRPWQNGGLEIWDPPATETAPKPPEVVAEVLRSPLTLQQTARMAQLASAAAVVSNVLAARNQLPLGGYASAGICIDSTAVIEQALLGQTSLFPIIVAGPVRQAMVETSIEIELHQKRDKEFCGLLGDLRRALVSLPNDTTIGPVELESACARLLACLPKDVPYAAAEECRSDVAAVLERAKKRRGYGADVVANI